MSEIFRIPAEVLQRLGRDIDMVIDVRNFEEDSMSMLVTIVEYYSRRSNGYAVETKRKCGMHFHRQKKKK